MKTTIKILALMCALAMILTLAACGGKKEAGSTDSGKSAASGSGEAASSAEEVQSNLTDFEWVKFEMPAGYSDAKESDYYVTIRQDDNDKHCMKISERTLTGGKTAAELAAEKADDRYTPGESFIVNSREWYPVSFQFNKEDSVILYSDVDERNAAEITVYQMTQDDPDVQTVLNSIEFVAVD